MLHVNFVRTWILFYGHFKERKKIFLMVFPSSVFRHFAMSNYVSPRLTFSFYTKNRFQRIDWWRLYVVKCLHGVSRSISKCMTLHIALLAERDARQNIPVCSCFFQIPVTMARQHHQKFLFFFKMSVNENWLLHKFTHNVFKIYLFETKVALFATRVRKNKSPSVWRVLWARTLFFKF